MPRFFKENIEAEPFIDGEDADHIIRSLRVRIGEKLTVCDTHGADYECSVSGIAKGLVSLDIINKSPNVSEPDIETVLYQCMPKSDKMETVIKQAVQLGVGAVVPVISSRCVSVPNEKALEAKTVRWQRISLEAAKQSGRGVIPEIRRTVSFNEMLRELGGFDASLLFYERGGSAIKNIPEGIKKIALIIGPEGGFSPEEAKLAEDSGATLCTLGKRILRTETAPLAALCSVMISTGNME